MLLHTTSYARAGLVGNPSDGYYGKTVAFSFQDFSATVTMYETPEVQIIPAAVDDALFPDMDALVKDVRLYGYYGGMRLLKATAKVFAVYCAECGITLPKRNFTVRYESDIPRLVGLGGSSAICTAMFKSLMRFYDVTIPAPLAATLCWRAENEELGITCGLQDRVVQLYDGLVFMDFDRGLFERQGFGRYEYISPGGKLPGLYLAYDPNRAELSGIYHRRLRVLFEEKNHDIMGAMSEFADLARQARDALESGRVEKLPELIDANFDLRHRVFNVAAENVRMVKQARSVGASAKFAGSGGAIVGTYEDDAMYEALCVSLAEIDCRVLKPRIVAPAVQAEVL